MIDIEKINCTGCSACVNICSKRAAELVQDEKGFYIPSFDVEKCCNCGLCEKICPQINNVKKNKPQKYSYAAKGNDKIREKSASGGVFGVIANYVLDNNGFVVGASFASDYKEVGHIIINKKEDLHKLQTSKYLQSKIDKILIETKKLLQDNKLVLFTGAPCQIAGLKAFLNKDYDNLITIDILCHGVPSQKVWEKYIDENIKDEKIEYVNFREKAPEQLPYFLKIVSTLPNGDKKTFKGYLDNDEYFAAFLKNLCLNKSCLSCKYTTVNRMGDITLGDFWGIEKFCKKINDNKGISCIIVNTDKGKKVISKIKKELELFKKVPIKYAIKGNPVLIEPCKAHTNCDYFWKNFNKKPLKDNVYDCVNDKYDGVITNLWYGINYGANLTSFALQKFFENLGYDYKILNWIPYNYVNGRTKPFIDFENKYLKLTHKIETQEDFEKLNACADNFISGSDQILRMKYIWPHLDKILASYTHFSKKRIIFSGSFGTNEFDIQNEADFYNFKKYLKRFDFVSTREISGVDIFKNQFNMVSEHIIDPVFLIDKNNFVEIADKSNNDYSNKIVSYVLDENDECEKLYEKLENKYNLKVERIFRENLSFEDLLSAIKNCEYFITDSFHGACFGIIFNKKFICLKNEKRGSARFESLEKTFEIKFNNDFVEADYKKIDNIIQKETIKATNWIKKALSEPKKINDEIIKNELDCLSIKPNLWYLEAKDNNRKLKFIKRIFSVKRYIRVDKKHKIITVFGIKFKVRIK